MRCSTYTYPCMHAGCVSVNSTERQQNLAGALEWLNFQVKLPGGKSTHPGVPPPTSIYSSNSKEEQRPPPEGQRGEEEKEDKEHHVGTSAHTSTGMHAW